MLERLTMIELHRYYDKQGFVRLGDVVDEPDWPATVLERRVMPHWRRREDTKQASCRRHMDQDGHAR